VSLSFNSNLTEVRNAVVAAVGSLKGNGKDSQIQKYRMEQSSDVVDDADALLAQTAEILGPSSKENGVEEMMLGPSGDCAESSKEGPDVKFGSEENPDDVLDETKVLLESRNEGSEVHDGLKDPGGEEETEKFDSVALSEETLLAETAQLIADAPEIDLGKEMRRIKVSRTAPLILVCCGTALHLGDLFLLDVVMILPLRIDITNEAALMKCEKILSANSYEVKSRDAGQIRGSFQEARTQAKAEKASPKYRNREDGDFMQRAMDRIQHTITKADALNLKRQQEGEAEHMRNYRDAAYVHLAVGVETKTLQRVLMLCGVDHEKDEVLRALIESKLTTLTRSLQEEFGNLQPGGSCDEQYLKDLKEAWRIHIEAKLQQMVRADEAQTLEKERLSGQLLRLLYNSYKAYGVQFPELAKPPLVSEFDLEYEDTEAATHEDEQEQEELFPAELEDKEQRKVLAKTWNNEMLARKRRKDCQLTARLKVCKSNRKVTIERLRDSDVARTSRDTIVLCKETNVPPSVVLASVPCIFERRPGKLCITFTHVIFMSNILGFKKNAAFAFSEIVKFQRVATSGAASVVGEAVILVGLRSQGPFLRFIIPQTRDAEGIHELVKDIIGMKEAQRLRSSSSASSSQQEAAEDPSVGAQEVVEQEQKRKLAEMQKMMTSTLLREDEEEF